MNTQQNHFGLGIVSLLLLASIACAQSNSPQSIAVEPNQAKPNSPPAYQLKTVLRDLEHPWSMVWLPDGNMLITERPGRLRRLKPGESQAAEISGLPEVFAQGQGGLMDIAIHPQFAENRWVYFTYAHGTIDSNQTRLARAQLDGTTLKNLQVIFEVSPSKSGTQHFGSRIAWMPDGTILLAIGDGGNPPLKLAGELIRQQAQNRRSHLGKVLRLKDDGSIPKDNPWIQRKDTTPALWSYGHRNIQGLAIDPQTQQIWTTEHGAKGGDEVNLMQAGQNYGWPLVTHGRDYSGGEISKEKSQPGLIDPKVVWTPSIAPSGLMVYRGDLFPQWQGNLFAGGLVSRDIRRIELDSEGQEKAQVSIPVGDRVRDVRQGPDGLIYILTDERSGQLIRLEPTNPPGT